MALAAEPPGERSSESEQRTAPGAGSGAPPTAAAVQAQRLQQRQRRLLALARCCEQLLALQLQLQAQPTTTSTTATATATAFSLQCCRHAALSALLSNTTALAEAGDESTGGGSEPLSSVLAAVPRLRRLLTAVVSRGSDSQPSSASSPHPPLGAAAGTHGTGEYGSGSGGSPSGSDSSDVDDGGDDSEQGEITIGSTGLPAAVGAAALPDDAGMELNQAGPADAPSALLSAVRQLVRGEVAGLAATLLSACYGQLGAAPQQHQPPAPGPTEHYPPRATGSTAGQVGRRDSEDEGEGLRANPFASEDLREYDDAVFTFSRAATGPESGNAALPAPGALSAPAALVAAGCPLLGARLREALRGAARPAAARADVGGSSDEEEGPSGSPGVVAVVGWPRGVQLPMGSRVPRGAFRAVLDFLTTGEAHLPGGGTRAGLGHGAEGAAAREVAVLASALEMPALRALARAAVPRPGSAPPPALPRLEPLLPRRMLLLPAATTSLKKAETRQDALHRMAAAGPLAATGDAGGGAWSGRSQPLLPANPAVESSLLLGGDEAWPADAVVEAPLLRDAASTAPAQTPLHPEANKGGGDGSEVVASGRSGAEAEASLGEEHCEAGSDGGDDGSPDCCGASAAVVCPTVWIPAHRSIMAARCDYLAAVCSTRWREREWDSATGQAASGGRGSGAVGGSELYLRRHGAARDESPDGAGADVRDGAGVTATHGSPRERPPLALRVQRLRLPGCDAEAAAVIVRYLHSHAQLPASQAAAGLCGGAVGPLLQAQPLPLQQCEWAPLAQTRAEQQPGFRQACSALLLPDLEARLTAHWLAAAALEELTGHFGSLEAQHALEWHDLPPPLQRAALDAATSLASLEGEIKGVGTSIKKVESQIVEVEEKLSEPGISEEEKQRLLKEKDYLHKEEEQLRKEEEQLREEELLLLKKELRAERRTGVDNSTTFAEQLLMRPLDTPPALDDLKAFLTEPPAAQVPMLGYAMASLDAGVQRYFTAAIGKLATTVAFAVTGDIVFNRNSEMFTLIAEETVVVSPLKALDSALPPAKRLGMVVERNQGESTSIMTVKSDTGSSLRSDGILRDTYGVRLLAKWEDTAENLQDAVEDLRKKTAAWTPLYYGDIEYLPSFATANDKLQFYAITASNGGVLAPRPVSPVYHLTAVNDRAWAVLTAIKFYQLLLAQRARYPKNVLAAGRDLTAEHSSAGFKRVLYVLGWGWEGFFRTDVLAVRKRVHPWSKYAAWSGVCFKSLQDLYKATEQRQGLVHAVDGKVSLECDIYSVDLVPVGLQANDVALQDEDGARLLAHDLLHGLDAIHQAGFVHRDLRWDNIACSPAAGGSCHRWFLIDLEACVPADQPPVHSFRPAGWHPDATLVAGRYTCASDLYHLGLLLVQKCDTVVASAEGEAFLAAICTPPRDQQQSAADLLSHAWLKCRPDSCKVAGAQPGER
ncbi:hypothetical protein GPECTOR_46g214 [Gonium pectorale]|uniref:Protein kinase domain-containing protein n=1 Tax=Gonium pectorale TaxID=33097 RepID=A0A150G9B0_GONPE|nr:hypothetical protein GPECTOR_46g214 [Gonium pectorale]|eukprot:KXZ46145.1 hypothetical protein GPECTOR_46g214 [Gonium pectorale]